MSTVISTKTSGVGGLTVTGDASGVLQLASANGTTAVTIDASQNVGIGTSSPSGKLHVQNSTNAVLVEPAGTWAAKIYQAQDTAAYNGLVVGNRWAATTSTVFEAGSLFGAGSGLWKSFYKIDGIGTHVWGNNTSEAMRIDSSGNLLVGTTTVVNTGKVISGFNGSSAVGFVANDTASASGGVYYGCSLNGTFIGSIQRVGATSAVVYNTTSDQRLKSNIADSNSVISSLMNVKVRQYDWTEGALHQDYGFIAQELEPVLSGIVTKGKTEEDMWQLDYSRLTPHLVKAIQEQQTLIEALTARLTALEGVSQ